MMYHYTMLQWLLFLYIYCFLGWCWETSYVSIKKGKFENRGFLRGPFLPIYGTGAIMMLIVAGPFRDNLILTYFAGVVGATTLELVTGMAMEMMFKVRYWDYSMKFCNYKGYICLGSSIAWGFFTIILTRYLHNPIERLVLSVPQNVINVISIILTIYIVTDFALSFHGAFKLRDILDKVHGIVIKKGAIEDRINAMIGFSDGNWKRFILRRHLGRIRGNATMVSRKYASALRDIKEFMAKPKAHKRLKELIRRS